MFSRVNDCGGQAPALGEKRAACRRARACPSPCLDLHEKQPWSAWGFRAGRALAGDRPPRYGCRGRRCFTVGRGPVSRHASICTGNGRGWRSVFAQIDRSRGTGPRATVCKAASFHRRARACPSPCLDLHEKQPWAVDDVRADRALAGDRPPRYG